MYCVGVMCGIDGVLSQWQQHGRHGISAQATSDAEDGEIEDGEVV